jgi:hypothetical protein
MPAASVSVASGAESRAMIDTGSIGSARGEGRRLASYTGLALGLLFVSVTACPGDRAQPPPMKHYAVTPLG